MARPSFVRRSLRSFVVALLATLAVSSSALAAAELIVDNTGSSVQVKGPWTTTTTTPGFYGADYVFRTPGDGSATVTWSFPANAPGGKYELFARWSSGPNRATNATYLVRFEGGAASVPVNQRDGGGAWRSLGSFDFQPGKGEGVTLSDKADGVVVADAVRWVGPAGSAPAPSQAVVAAATPTTPATPTATPAPVAVAANPTAAPASPTAAPASPTAAPASPTPVPGAPTGTPAGSLVAAAPSPTPSEADPRFFPQTRYRIAEDAFWDYFQKRGGVRTFGYPVSNTFSLLGMQVQVFQRQVLQLRPDGGVQTMNILDEGLMPYTKANGSTFPAPDPNVIKGSPRPDDPEYLDKALQFVRDVAPDEWDGQQTNFASTFFGSVRPEDAYPDGVPEGLEGLVPAFNLEVWGLPTSRPTYDPANRNFIYQRFQRGIMHYDKTTGVTQGLLLADYLKAILTNRNLPGDLAQQAKGSRLFAQWAPGQPGWLARPNDLGGSNLDGAFRRDPAITVDAGHGGKEIGSSRTYSDGYLLQEKALNLRVAQRLRELLQQAGFDVAITRTSDAQVNVDNKDLTGDGKVSLSDDLQARVDIANKFRSDILVSVHFNGVSDPNMKGTYVFWNPDRPFADRGKALAELVDAALVRSMKEAGYTPVDRGARTDSSVLGGGYYYLLSPKSEVVARPSEMPAVIGEPLFLTNADDGNALRNDRIVDAIARGYLEGIKAYFARYPPN